MNLSESIRESDMFTGIIEGTAVVTNVNKESGEFVLKPQLLKNYDFVIGDSVSINGCCLSITSYEDTWTFFISRESFDKTNLGQLSAGSLVNFERAVKVGDRLGGHWVTGHVDCTANIVSIDTSKPDWLACFELESGFARYLVDKGSICIDGVSLTVNQIEDKGDKSHFYCTVIPITQEVSAFSDRQAKDRVNIEVDILAKHLERLSKFC